MKFLNWIGGLVLFIVSAEGLSSPISAENFVPITSLQHACGTIYYSGPSNLSDSDILALKDLIAFLYRGGNLFMTYPGAPKPALNEATRQSFLNSRTIKSNVEGKGIPNPTKDQLIEEGTRLFESDPAGWNINEGPSADRLKQILADSGFAKRAGKTVMEGIKARMSGKLGQRRDLINQLKAQFKIREDNQLVSYEACEILDSLGPE